jgi:hypothetical protein
MSYTISLNPHGTLRDRFAGRYLIGSVLTKMSVRGLLKEAK